MGFCGFKQELKLYGLWGEGFDVGQGSRDFYICLGDKG